MTRKKPEKVREAKEAEKKKQRLDELLQACGVPNDERTPGKRWRRSYDVGLTTETSALVAEIAEIEARAATHDQFHQLVSLFFTDKRLDDLRARLRKRLSHEGPWTQSSAHCARSI
jgi:hypothetical protein